MSIIYNFADGPKSSLYFIIGIYNKKQKRQAEENPDSGRELFEFPGNYFQDGIEYQSGGDAETEVEGEAHKGDSGGGGE